MNDKKTAVITFRTHEWVKEQLNEAARQNNWSQALLVEQVCKNFIINPEPNIITIKATDLIHLANEIKEEGCGGVELSIDFRFDEEKQYWYKELTLNGLEAGGMGCIGMFDTAVEMTPEEILDIP